MDKKFIITISRQYASGGRSIGKILAQELELPFYDKELITLASKKSGFREQLFENADKQAVSSLLYSLSMGMYNTAGIDGTNNLSLNDRVFLIQHEVIREISQQGPCVIVGRCADYVLKDQENVLNIFIHADMESRKRRAVEEYGLDSNKPEAAILKMDKRRAAYYEYYTGMKWGRMENYHLTLNSAILGVQDSAKLIKDFIERCKGISH